MNKSYWNKYYSKKLRLQEQTSFAIHVLNMMSEGNAILELGCGNGRDSFFFANHGIQVYALDQSEIVINQIKGDNINPRFICKDILSIKENFTYEINHGYARFVLHALNKAEAEKAIAIMNMILPINGYFFSESRSIKSSLYGTGHALEQDIYETDHKRRFLRKNDLIHQLKSYGFTIENVIESDGLAIYQEDDPVVIRISARKSSNIE
ncbi:MAG: class I SAM-dependent methyltransferase [Candidatus Neomarinimicrobiota bacterium]|nr:class I SAM-dependent methyltransferase [Candidatus Neomarinimicrobiota bacterium]